MKTRNRIWLCRLIMLGLVLILTHSCNKDEEPNDQITDIDGNVYTSVTIGTQLWMGENLKTTKYRNGDLIGTTTPATLDITGENTPKYQWAYDGNESNVTTYGRLYTWYVVTDSRDVCPTGWHIPSDAEWTILTDYLANNGYGYEGSGNDIGKSMATTSGWDVNSYPGTVGNDQASNNSSGFSGPPGGYRNINGLFSYIGEYANWWSTTEYAPTGVYSLSLHDEGSNAIRSNSGKGDAISVRCLKD